MFCDSVLLNVNNNNSNNDNYNDSKNNENHSNMDSTNDITDNSHNKSLPQTERTQTITEVPQMSSLPICVIRSQFINESISVEEVPTKEPQLTAVPKKSALKKPRIASAMSCPPNNSSTNEIHNQQNSSPALMHTNINANTSNSSPILIRPQPSPRFTYNSVPMQIVVTSAQHNPNINNQSQTMK
jgi:hypothetical protein